MDAPAAVRRLLLLDIAPTLAMYENTSEAFARAMQGLSSHQRQVVHLRFYGDLSLREIADTLHVPLGTVKTWLHRSLLQIRNTLEPELTP